MVIGFAIAVDQSCCQEYKIVMGSALTTEYLERIMNTMISPTAHHRPKLFMSRNRLISILGALGLFLAAMLMAQSDRERMSSTEEPQAISLKGCSSAGARANLPALPKAIEQEEVSPILGVASSAPPSNLATDPDEYKSLLGYSGPYYNVEELDGRVLVLRDTVYVWPSESWRATGLLRNQSCETVSIGILTARLMGATGELLKIVTAAVPISDLRPGEPAPFEIEASIPRDDVVSVEWHIDYRPTSKVSRSFALNIFETASVLEGSRYSLFGTIRNVDSVSATNVRVVAAWLNKQGRVFYIASPKIRLITDPTIIKNEIDLAAGDFEDFLYITDDKSLVPLLDGASIALWSVAN